MAKKFFYVCAGMMLLALAYTAGTSRAIAQGQANAFVGVGATESGTVVITQDGTTYLDWGTGFQPSVRVPGGSRVSAASARGVATDVYAVCEDGSAYHNSTYAMHAMNSAWELFGRVPNGSTSTTQSSWGALKSQFH